MTNTKHTPGPWRIDFDGVLCAPANKEIGRQFDKTIAQFPWSSFSEFNEPENKANARLIAAAPKLLEALEELYENVADTDSGFMVKAKNAIAKAKAA